MTSPEQTRHSQSWFAYLREVLISEPLRALQIGRLEKQNRSQPAWQLHLKRRTLESLHEDSPSVREFKRGKRLILACDGGGIFGIVTLHCLKELEYVVGAPVFDIFDMFAGTSTGAIIAAGLAAGISVDDLIMLYRDKRAEIFAPTLRHSGLFRALGKFNLAIPKYPKQPIRCMLHSVLGDLVLAELPRDLLITAKDTVRGETVFFTAFHNPADRSSPKAWVDHAYGTYKDALLRAVVEASMSAPTYFQPLGRFIDGGVGEYNNACYVAAAEALRYSQGRYKADQIIVYSFGTGASLEWQPAGAAQKMGLLDWAQYVINVGLRDANNQQVYVASQELCQAERAIDFRRYQFYFTDEGLRQIGVVRPPQLKSYGDLELDSIAYFDHLNEVGIGFAKYLREKRLFSSPQSRLIEEIGKPKEVLPPSYIAEIQDELKRAVVLQDRF